ncbi:hypothetical protein [Chryseobacterium sp. IT-36CA2]|uniref:hypothetical protein n=1 Tax=Chryseobacterium sp. IT-36CA2 TaxID=3026460 RepID=UPI0039E08FD7
MKTLFRNILFFSIPLILFISFVEYSLRIIPNDYSYKEKYLSTKSSGIELLYLGNSHIYFGLNPEYSKYKSFNAAAISQTIDIDVEILNKYKKWDSLKVIVLPVDYLTMYFRLENQMDSWRLKNYTLYYGFPSKNIENHFELFNGKFSKNFNRLTKYYFQEKNNIDCNKLGFGIDYVFNKSENLKTTSESAIKRHSININDPKYKSNFDQNTIVVDRLIKFAKQNKIKLIFVSTPVSKYYFNESNNVQMNKTLRFVISIVKDNASFCTYLNFMNDKNFVDNDFFDGDHLNNKGAKKFTQMLDDEIKF